MDKITLKIMLTENLKDTSSIFQLFKKDCPLQITVRLVPTEGNQLKDCLLDWEPDLLIMKITDDFPIWNFMDEVKRPRNDLEIILLSNVKNFDYAYQAIRHHAFNFLLEPVTKETWLLNLLDLAEKRKQLNELKADKQKLEAFELKKHQELMEKIIFNMLEKPEELEFLLSEVNNRYQTELYNDNFQTIVINTDRQEMYYEKSGFLGSLLTIIENSFPWAHEVISAVIMPYGITAILNFSYSKYSEYKISYIDDLYRKIVTLKKKYGEFQVALGIGTIVHTMKDINLSLEEAFRAEQYKLVRINQSIFYASLIPKTITAPNTPLSLPQKKTLIRCLKNTDLSGIKKWFEEIISQAESKLKNFPEGYEHLKEEIISITQEVWKSKDTEDYLSMINLSIQQMNHIFNGRKRLELLRDDILSAASMKKQCQNTEPSELIQKALEYIRHHYRESITLEQLAGICGLSANYFSTVFKEQVGETYIDYLTEIRLLQSKNLLKESVKTIKEISGEVGYIDDKYFRKLFKNRFGITPSAYRKTHVNH